MNFIFWDLLIVGISFSTLGIALTKTLTPKFSFVSSVILFAIPADIVYMIAEYSECYKTIFVSFEFQQNIKTLRLMGVYLAYCVFAFKDTFPKKIRAFIALVVFLVIYEGVMTAVITTVFGVTSSEEFDSEFKIRLIIKLVSIIVYSLTGMTIYLVCKKIKFQISKKVLFNLTAIIIVNCIMIAFIFTSNAYNKDVFTKIVLLGSPLLLLFLCLSMYKLMKRLSETEVMKEKLYWVENVKGMELEYYNKLQEKTNEVRKIRHDFKDNLETAKLLIKENSEESIEKASEIISAMEKSINATKLPVYSENIVVNAIVGAKSEEASKKGIALEAQIDVPKELSIESIDLNCVFLNLLNNAIEATEKLEKSEKTISLRSEIKAGYLFVKVENEFETIETNQGGKLLTTKEDKENHGIGTSLLSEIAKKYDGEFETKQDDNKFSAIVSLRV